MKRIQKGPVRGISLKLQEEERERRMEFVPDQSEVNTEFIQVDPDTRDMLKELEMDRLPNITTSNVTLTGTVKKAARVIVEKYYSKLTLDFQVNKKITEEVATVPSKRLRNKIAGFTTHLMKRIQKGPVRGISLKLQEEERERRMEFVPDQSEVNTEFIQAGPE
ncbi:RPS17 [Symbiodinium microadriaticum]|nr:RPS17 [Symbiodinium microadriaticum]